ncbi:CoA:oxalate CoA-transferase [Dethiosulfatibacter aminovorans DSM 17477]|uniref:CoA:oxalate CoA-transferase n=1 Tax=Dethiosulfatibacter aminovorans DSM 17477 TaxID=1121476 RepID=A0A1M6KVL9_9FIRM|nr:CoA transferase [Dethiosulfatibacter aminovorans]SHJ62922.1 CoA:oxalate CoA-transferase [Dethiosulfatibacter aminovorans DSM 17477]
MGVLNGIKILDLTRVLSGPFCSMILGDMGAEITKIERPDKGDDSREVGPFVNGESTYFMSINRNKKSLAVDLRTEEGHEIFNGLVKDADVIIENYKPGTMEKLGISYDDVLKIKPDIIYCSISGYGQTGPMSDKPAYDAVIQAMGGLMSITGQEKPTRVGSSLGDITAALYGAIGILGALYRKKDTGKGERIDISMLDCQVSILENAIARYTVTGEVPQPLGNRHATIAPLEPFMTRNGEIMIGAGNDKLWDAFCRAVDREDLIDDYRFFSNEKRVEYYHELKPIMNKIFIENTTEEWQKILDDAGVPNSPINTIDKLLENEQLKEREMFKHINHPVAGNILAPASPVKYSENPNDIREASPILGQHTMKILTEKLNYSQNDIKELIKKGIIK